ncbi:hypothetical protein V6N13_118259 [Hibiscus sabdariffa]|uniref:Uncharacterized protein n=1 Tax=Hibiscus sabdariffa TaxID=183260 RepID=A0ABR2Q8A5_9ROSI
MLDGFLRFYQSSMYFQLSAFPVGQLNWSSQNLKAVSAIDFSCSNKVRLMWHQTLPALSPALVGTKSNIFYIEPFDASTGCYLDLLAIVCTVESVISDGV